MHLLRGGGGGGGGGGCVVHSGAAPLPRCTYIRTTRKESDHPPTATSLAPAPRAWKRTTGASARRRTSQHRDTYHHCHHHHRPRAERDKEQGGKRKLFLCEDGESRASRANHGPGAASLLARRGARRLRLKMFARCFARRSNFFGSPTSLCRGAVPAGKAHAAIARLQHAAAAMARQAAVLRQGTAALRVIWPVGAAGGRRWLVSCRAACPLPQHEGNRGLFPPATATYGTAATATATAARPETASRRPASAWPGATSCA